MCYSAFDNFNRSYLIVVWGEEGNKFETLFTGLGFNLYLDYIIYIRFVSG